MDWTHLLWNYARIGNLIAIQKMFAEGRASPYDVNPHGSNALTYAVGYRPNIVRFLLQQGAEADLPNQAGRTASEMFWEHSFAGRLGSEGASTFGSFFEDGDYVQTRRFTTLHKAVLGIIHKDLGAELELSTAEINARDTRGRTPLCWAVIRDDLSAVRILLTFGANPNILDDLGHTALHFVRSVGICKLLLDAKVDVHARNAYYGRTALHPYGGRTREIKVVDMLIQAGIDVDARDADGETPLMNAIYYTLTPMAHRLLELGANVNATNWSNKYSPLHFAAEFDEYTIMPALLEKGADYTAQNKYGRTIAHLAARYAGTHTLSILAKANLDRLDATLRDKGGKTATEYLIERCISLDIDQGVRDEFHKLLELRMHSKQCQPGEHSCHPELRASHDLDKEIHLPGAYPLNDGS
jgi:ankyrin repeat protein